MPAYLDRGAADAEYGGDPGHLYQGDLLLSLGFMVPLADGSWDEKLWDAVIISHDCEYTKTAAKPGHPLLIAPVRALSDYQQPDLIREGRNFSLWLLPVEQPVADEVVVDFRMIEPIAVRQLQESNHWACMSPETRVELRGRLERFLFRAQLAK